jgi:hypothetical protein
MIFLTNLTLGRTNSSAGPLVELFWNLIPWFCIIYNGCEVRKINANGIHDAEEGQRQATWRRSEADPNGNGTKLPREFFLCVDSRGDEVIQCSFPHQRRKAAQTSRDNTQP